MDQPIDTTQATQANQDQVFDFEFDFAMCHGSYEFHRSYWYR